MPGGDDHRDGDGWRAYWLWFAVALLLLLWVDLATTVAAADHYGLEAEANPVMRGLLEAGISMTLAIHLLVFAVALAGFGVIVNIGRRLDNAAARHYRLCCLGWIGVLLIGGIGVTLNNVLLVIVAIIG